MARDDSFKDVRTGEGGFSKHSRGDEDSRKDGGVSKRYRSPMLTTDGTGHSVPISGKDRQPDAHGFGHEGKSQVRGAMRLSGDKRAHRVGARKK
jgi:hypothetical protein